MSMEYDFLKDVFIKAVGISNGSERHAFLNGVCVGNERLRAEVDALLVAEESASGFLAVAAIEEELGDAEAPGEWIGRYKLIEKIGEGGWGVVYLAEQEEPVRRQVALKIIKLGMDTRSVIARFRAEQQALAMMNHPHIAKVLDAGATAAGRPFFVMEYVPDNRKITDYCDREQLSLPERIELFLQVCSAVQHAHQKGVIHRDLKPSNILVAGCTGEDSETAGIKVIDFGVAKAVNGVRLGDTTVDPRPGQFIGTPNYMSPEQAQTAEGADVDTRTDVYSLGLLLYELITGYPAFEGRNLSEVGLYELRRQIQEEEPPRPSARVGSLSRVEKEMVACARNLHPDRLVRELRGDLDWVALKCLEKDRSRRYETVNGLAADLRRYLNHEPVVARPPARTYQMTRFAHRHRMGVTASALILVTLAGSTAVSLSLAQVAVAERERAQGNEERAVQVAGFLQNMLQGVGPSVAMGRDTTLLREILDTTATRLDELESHPEVEARLRSTLGTVYSEIGEQTHAESMHRRALEIRQLLYPAVHPEIAQTLNDLGQVFHRRSEWERAAEIHREALQMRQSLFTEPHLAIAESLNNLGDSLRFDTNHDEAEALLRAGLGMRRKLLTAPDPVLAESIDNVGRLLLRRGLHPESENLQREALDMRRQLFGSDHADVATSLARLGLVVTTQGRPEAAEPYLREALAIRTRLFGEMNLSVATTLNYLADALLKQDQPEEAEEHYRRALGIRRTLLGDDHSATIMGVRNLGALLSGQQRYDEAEPLLKEALEGARATWGVNHEATRTILAQYGRLLRAQRKFNSGQIFGRGEEVADDEHWFIGAPVLHLGHVLSASGRRDDEEAHRRRVIAARRDIFEHPHPMVADSLHDFALVLSMHGKLDGSVSAHREALEIRRAQEKPDDFTIAWSLLDFALVLEAQENAAEAEQARREAIELLRTRSDEDEVRSMHLLAWLLATTPQANLRDGHLALSLVRELAADVSHRHLDTTAAAYAETGDFQTAVQIQQEAVELAPDEQARQDYGRRLALYQEGQSYRERVPRAAHEWTRCWSCGKIHR